MSIHQPKETMRTTHLSILQPAEGPSSRRQSGERISRIEVEISGQRFRAQLTHSPDQGCCIPHEVHEDIIVRQLKGIVMDAVREKLFKI